jgi:hypothetical protein
MASSALPRTPKKVAQEILAVLTSGLLKTRVSCLPPYNPRFARSSGGSSPFQMSDPSDTIMDFPTNPRAACNIFAIATLKPEWNSLAKSARIPKNFLLSTFQMTRASSSGIINNASGADAEAKPVIGFLRR